jgi:hypothetical protein
LQEIKALSGRADILPEIKIPKKRAKRKKETAPRKQPEALFRNQAIKYLRSKGCVVKRIENAITGYHNSSIGDLLVFCPRTAWGGFIELKAEAGVLSEGQKEFRKQCLACNVKHIVARRLTDLWEVYL